MAQKVSPIAHRLGISVDWQSKWTGLKNYKEYLHEDIKIRSFLRKKLRGMGVHAVAIERGPDKTHIIIHSSRPGLIIGRGGAGMEEIKRDLDTLLGKGKDVANRAPRVSKEGKNAKVIAKKATGIKIDIQEYRKPETSARIVAEQIAEQVEKRLHFRRVMKQMLAKVISHKEVKGVRIQLSGRLNGAEIARSEHLDHGSLPLQTLMAAIDYAQETALTTYGTIGIKVWIYKTEEEQ